MLYEPLKNPGRIKEIESQVNNYCLKKCNAFYM